MGGADVIIQDPEEQTTPQPGAEWTRVKLHGYCPPMLGDAPCWNLVDGQRQRTRISESEPMQGAAPDWVDAHVWNETPGFDDPDVYVVTAGGATPNDTTGDTEPIQRAIEEHAKVFLPPREPSDHAAQRDPAPGNAWLAVMWQRDQFRPLTGSGNFGFGSSVDAATLRVDLQSFISESRNELRCVIINHDGAAGERWCISEAAYKDSRLGDGYWQLQGFSGSSDAGRRWAVFAPTELAFAIPDPASLSFAAKTFDDVRAVGLIYRGSRWGGFYAFEFTRVLAIGMRNP